jgi:hypothetical protein
VLFHSSSNDWAYWCIVGHGFDKPQGAAAEVSPHLNILTANSTKSNRQPIYQKSNQAILSEFQVRRTKVTRSGRFHWNLVKTPDFASLTVMNQAMSGQTAQLTTSSTSTTARIKPHWCL